MDRREWLALLGTLGAGLATANPLHARTGDPPQDHDHGHPKTEHGLEPVRNIHAHFCGIHVAKANPKFQLIAQHYCAPRSAEMHQCLLYDSTEKNAKLLGVEYIVSDQVYRQLPEDEKKYWHPHTYEVLAGGLIAPGMEAEDELKFMKAILTTWGKTWHTWPDPNTDVPIGEPLLMWAVTGDGQLSEQVITARDKQFNCSMEKIREDRVKQIGFHVPQVPLPKNIEQVGRQWTAEGEDKPRSVN